MFNTPAHRRSFPHNSNNKPSQKKISSDAKKTQAQIKQYFKTVQFFSNQRYPHQQIKNSDSLQQEAKSVLSQLSQSAFLVICQKFQQSMTFIYETLNTKIVELELQLANCQRFFNSIELLLVKKSKQIRGIQERNIVLMMENKKVEQKLKSLREQHESSLFLLKNNEISKSIRQLKNQLNKMQENENLNGKCKFCDKKLNEILSENFRKLQKLRDSRVSYGVDEVLQNILSIVIREGEFMNKSMSQFAQSKIIENIELKCRISELQMKLGPKSEQKQKKLQQYMLPKPENIKECDRRAVKN